MPADITGGLDWSTLRKRSLLPGGFGSDRNDLWPQLLHTSLVAQEDEQVHEPGSSTASHRDERQIGLDTDRSFVLYPVESVEGQDREDLQRRLHSLLVSIFRKRPKLSYFQGYHDIVTVLFLTLPENQQLPCAEQMSLHRLRDAMGKGLEPVVGLLYVLKNLLHLADPEYASLLEESTPIPYFALSNLLTLFSHDVPTLPLIQHVFDYLLCRPPVASVYLAASIILSRKEEALRLQEEGEEGMLHSLLSQLPDIYEEVPDDTSAQPPPSNEDNLDVAIETLYDTEQANVINTREALPPPVDGSSAAPPALATYKIAGLEAELTQGDADLDEKVPFLASANSDLSQTPPESLSDSALKEAPSLVAELNNVPIFVPPGSSPTSSRSNSPSLTDGNKRARISLSILLQHADDLYSLYPPTTPSLALDRVFAANSVIYTWHEDPSLLPKDDDAEEMVEHPELIVLPYAETLEEEKEKAELEQKEKERETRRRRKLQKRRRVVIERGVVLATAVVVVGVAMAVYGGRSSGMRVERQDWRRMSRWLGGALIGAGERLWNEVRAF